MGLLDDELKKTLSKSTRKPEWALCKYCKVPFLTCTFSDSCERCSHFIQYQIEFTAKVMLLFIIFATIFTLITIFELIYLWKVLQNYNLMLLAVLFSTTLQGLILWKIVRKMINK